MTKKKGARPKVDVDGLMPKQARFVQEYLKDLNGKQAAIRAGYAKPSAEVTGSKLLRVAKVAAALQKAMDARAAATKIDQDRVLKELGRIGFSDIRQFVNDSDQLRLVSGLPTDVAAALSSIEIVREKTTVRGKSIQTEQVIKVKLWDKLGALTTIARHLGMLNDKLRVDGDLKVTRDDADLKSANEEQLKAAAAHYDVAIAILKGQMKPTLPAGAP